MFFYEVLFPLALNRCFIYASENDIQIGTRVLTDFKNRKKIGIVWGKTDKKPDYDIKNIDSVLDKRPIVGAKLKKTIEFTTNYYMSFLGLVLKSAFAKRVFEIKQEIDTTKVFQKDLSITSGCKLNEEQQYIYDNIKKNEFNVNLIFGVTGSGKTEVYMKIMEDIIKSGKKAVVLVPEIVLTPQYIDVFSKRFSINSISIAHSRLTPLKRFENWLNFIKGKTSILIGTRSAVFADFEDVGIVIVDEENDESYKQENEPRYNAKDIAIYRAKQHNIPVILCSATPTLETYYKAVENKFKLFRLKKRIKNIPLPKVSVVKIGKNEIFSQYTLDKIEETLNKNKTVAVLINRRGFSNYLVCADCGYVFLCPNCSVSLTYHKKTNNLKCHWCESTFDIPKRCEKCGGENIIDRGIGSQQAEEFLRKKFKKNDIERFDRDSVLTKKEFDRIVGKLQKGEIDILVGTQMLSKGHDISKIGLVVIANLEELFGTPDFRAKEKALSLVIQTAGRSGRQEEGNVIVQTACVENDLIQYIKIHDYESFLKREIQNRKALGYPPFGRLVRIIIESKNNAKAIKTSKEIERSIKDTLTYLGPARCPLFKLRNNYRYHILIKTQNIMKTIMLIKEKISDFNEKVHFDVDPMSFF